MNNMFRLALVGGLALNFGCKADEPEAEICDNADVDDDGDGTADCDDSDCTDDPACADAEVDEDCDNGRDDDGDGDEDCDDSECRSDAACEEITYFEPYAMFMEGNFLYDAATDTIGSAIGSDGSPIPPTIGITFAEEAYFDAGDDRYTCVVYWTLDTGAPDRTSLVEGTVTHTGFWMPSTGTFQTNCESWDPEIWGDDLEAVFTSVEYAVGVGELSATLAKDAQWKDFVVRSTTTDFAFDQYVLGAGNGLRLGDTEQYSINSYSVGFAVDEAFNILVDDEGNGTLLNNTDVLGTETGLLPTAYYRVFAFYGFDPEGLYLGG